MNKARVLTAVPMAFVLAAATACGSGDDAQGGDGDTITVVASTNVWGSVAKAVGGDRVEVKSLVDDPSADPHSYEATAEDAADVQDGDVLLYNGGGYDSYFERLAEQAESQHVVVAYEGEGHSHDHGDHDHGDEHGDGGGPEGVRSQQGGDDHDHGDHEGHDHGDHEHGDEGGHEGHSYADGENEHVWYDLDVVSEVADKVATELGELQPNQKGTFDENAEKFTQRLEELEGKVDEIPDGRVLATEPVAHYLLEQAGLEDVTPKDYTRAVEGETDVPVAAQQQVTQMVSGGDVDVVVNNPQTVTSVTEQLVTQAGQNNVPVVEMTETLPQGQDDYVAWMSGQIDELVGALDK